MRPPTGRSRRPRRWACILPGSGITRNSIQRCSLLQGWLLLRAFRHLDLGDPNRIASQIAGQVDGVAGMSLEIGVVIHECTREARPAFFEPFVEHREDE